MVTATGLKALSPPLLALTAGAVAVPLVYPSLVGLALALLVLREGFSSCSQAMTRFHIVY
jgi:hypothetical protein